MRTRPTAYLLALASLLGFAQYLRAGDLDEYRSKYDASLAKIVLEAGFKRSDLNKQYAGAIAKLLASAQADGNLHATKAAIGEQERFARDRTMPAAPSSNLDIQRVQSSYLQQASFLTTEAATRTVTLHQQYDQALARLQKKYVQTGKLDAATKVESERKRVASSDEVCAARDALAEPTDKASGVAEAAPPSVRPLRASERWFRLFESDDPSIWNTKSKKAGDFALPCEDAPDGMQYLRLKELRGGRAIIVPLSKESLTETLRVGERYAWQGNNHVAFRGYHLGVFDTMSGITTKNVAKYVSVDKAYSDRTGWGFGHRPNRNDKQGYCWDRVEAKKCKFRIEVTTTELSEAEARQLLK